MLVKQVKLSLCLDLKFRHVINENHTVYDWKQHISNVNQTLKKDDFTV